jgi:hypothetical protein
MKKHFLTTFCIVATLGLFAQKNTNKTILFNGKDFTGWQKYLTIPHKSLELNLPKNDTGAYLEPLGFDNDPLNVFTVVTEDGQPAIKVTGQVFGHIRTTNDYENYHLTLQFKWGEAKYAPREKAKRDAGLLYHSIGVPAKNAPWSQSQECQIQEGDCGDYYVIGGSSIDVKADTLKKPFHYLPNGILTTFDLSLKRGSCKRIADFEKPHGEWNTIEIYTLGDKSIHLVNGHVVMALQNSRMRGEGGVKLPLTKGKIQLQSEGAEIFYKDMLLESIIQFPKEFADLF